MSINGVIFNYLFKFHWLLSLPPYVSPQNLLRFWNVFWIVPGGHVTAPYIASGIWIWSILMWLPRATYILWPPCCPPGHSGPSDYHHSSWIPGYFRRMMDHFSIFIGSHWHILQPLLLVWPLLFLYSRCASSFPEISEATTDTGRIAPEWKIMALLVLHWSSSWALTPEQWLSFIFN